MATFDCTVLTGKSEMEGNLFLRKEFQILEEEFLLGEEFQLYVYVMSIMAEKLRDGSLKWGWDWETWDHKWSNVTRDSEKHRSQR